MKKKSPPYAIIGAVALGILAVVFLFQHERSAQAAQKAAIDKANAEAAEQIRLAKLGQQAVIPETNTHMRNVLYATQPVEAGIRISAAFFEKKPTPEDILPDAYSDKSDIVGWFATRKIEKGDPLTPRNIGKSLPYMSQRISPGMRALALPIFNAEVNNTGGFIVDGDRVDLLYTTSQSNGVLVKTQMVMQNLSVLYVPGPPIKTDKTDGVNPIPPPGSSISVTFEVTPEQAQALIFMGQAKDGKFSMILRARKDNSQIKIKPFASEDYLGNFDKAQRMIDKSNVRVQELAAEIEAKEKTQGNTNETPTPTPPSP